MFGTLLSIVALSSVLAFIIARVEGLAFRAPKRTGGLTNPAADYCMHGCRVVDGRCPLTGSAEGALNCPLWKFIAANVPTIQHGSSFEHPQPAS
jgi:hypothetical protein